MKLTSIHLQNYRAHRDLRVEFADGFNAVAGINGSGKTSLLKGIGEALAGILQAVPNVSTSLLTDPACTHVSTLHVGGRYRFEPRYPITVTARGRHGEAEFEFEVRKTDEVAYPSCHPLSPFHQAISEAASHSKVHLPVLALYRANRQWQGQPSEMMTAATERLSRHDGYRSWDDAAASVTSLQHWVIAKCLERYQHSSETGKRFHEIQDDELALVNSALAAAVEDIGDLRYDMQQKALLVDWRRNETEPPRTISFANLSDGQRALICLVTDIARRICLLNPHLGMQAIANTPGVVLIDELDVHLHPRWQRRVVNGLKAAFPSVQFIVTSHSPQILGELHPDEIILLREGGTTQPQVSYGLDSSQVLEELMGAASRNLAVDDMLRQLFVQIENNRLVEAKTLLEELSHKAPQLPELSKAEALIRRKEIIGR